MSILDAPIRLGAGPLSIYQNDLAVDASTVSPVGVTFQQGSFTPKGDKVLIDVSLSIQLYGTSAGVVSMLYKPGGTPGALNSYVQGAPASGVLTEVIGSPAGGTAWSGPVHRQFTLSGLTPGVPVAWELTLGITGGNFQMVLSETPTDLSCSQLLPPSIADASFQDFLLACGGPTLGKVVRYETTSNGNELMTQCALPSASKGCAITDDGVYSVFCCQADNSAVVLNSDTGVATRYVLPDAGAGPTKAATLSTTAGFGWVAYITAQNGKVYVLNMATGAWNAAGTGGPFNLGASTAPTFLNTFGPHLLIACPGTDELVQVSINVAPGTIEARYSIPGIKSASGPPFGITVWATSDDPTDGWTERLINVNTHAVGTPFLPHPPGWTSGSLLHPIRGATFADGQSKLVAMSNTSGANQIGHVRLPNGPGITKWTNRDAATNLTTVAVKDLALSAWGDIFQATTGGLQIFPGGLGQIRAASGGGFHPEFSTMTVVGAS